MGVGGVPSKASNSNEPPYRIGDHVYVAPPFDQRDHGAPYVICRIMALPPTQPGSTPKARVAYYLRRRDVTNRSLADHRVIFATFMAGLVPLAHIRKKCQVMHRDYLEDPEAFKRQDDCFVFSQIYDRFMHKPFDLVPTSLVMNAPDEILEYLRSNYEFVCTELGTSSDLCDAMRGCVACHAFAQKDDSVSCAVCSRTWHLGCLDPPLAKKPALGWRWTCIPCSMQEDNDESDSDNVILQTSDRNATRAIAAAKTKQAGTFKKNRKGKGPALPVEAHLDVALWKMRDEWPYRYFGQHVDYTSILDPHDSIYPRASTRIGSRFQTSSIPGDEPDATAKRRPPIRKPKYSRAQNKQGPAIPVEKERGGDEACTLIWKKSEQFSEHEVDAFVDWVRKLPLYKTHPSVDFLDYALKVLTKAPTILSASKKLSKLTLADIPNLHSMTAWSPDEVASFDSALDNYEDELVEFKKDIPTKKYQDIVHYYYREKGYQRQHLTFEEGDHDKFNATAPSGVDAGETMDVDTEEDTSRAGSPAPGTKIKNECAVCFALESESWWRCPDGIGDSTHSRKDKVLCHSCSVQWRHYGNPNPALTAAELDARAAKDMKGRKKGPRPVLTRSPSPPGTPLSLAAEDIAPKKLPIKRAGTPPHLLMEMPNGLTIKSCVLCKRPEPKALNYQCVNCGLSCHTNCYGIPDGANRDVWLCDVCNPEENKNRHLHPSCPLCPPISDPDQPLSALDALKRTDGTSFIHLICALWHPEFTFQDATELDVVEGMALVSPSKFNKTCAVCNTTGVGACIKCEACPAYFHVSCAWTAGYKFSFEILPVKKKRQKDVPTAKFKTEEGVMRPLIQCKGHPYVPTRLLYELGQKDKISGLTALMTFTQNFKATKIADTFPLLRRARRMDSVVRPALSVPGILDANSDIPEEADDLYETKEPYYKTNKKTKSQSATKEALTSIQRSLGPTEDLSKQQPLANGEQNNQESNSKVRKPRNKRTREEESETSLSDDEVMPVASTSRSRKSVREVRSITKGDILGQRAPSPSLARHIPKSESAGKQWTQKDFNDMYQNSDSVAASPPTNGSAAQKPALTPSGSALYHAENDASIPTGVDSNATNGHILTTYPDEDAVESSRKVPSKRSPPPSLAALLNPEPSPPEVVVQGRLPNQSLGVGHNSNQPNHQSAWQPDSSPTIPPYIANSYHPPYRVLAVPRYTDPYHLPNVINRSIETTPATQISANPSPQTSTQYNSNFRQYPYWHT